MTTKPSTSRPDLFGIGYIAPPRPAKGLPSGNCARGRRQVVYGVLCLRFPTSQHLNSRSPVLGNPWRHVFMLLKPPTSAFSSSSVQVSWTLMKYWEVRHTKPIRNTRLKRPGLTGSNWTGRECFCLCFFPINTANKSHPSQPL